MINAEKYKNELLKFIEERDAGSFSFSEGEEGKFWQCGGRRCSECGMSKERSNCSLERLKWLLSEYKEPVKLRKLEYEILKWSEKEGYKYIARDEDGELCTFQSEPKKLNIAWDCCDVYIELPLFKKLFQFIQWEDKEATSIQEVLNNCVVIEDVEE